MNKGLRLTTSLVLCTCAVLFAAGASTQEEASGWEYTFKEVPDPNPDPSLKEWKSAWGAIEAANELGAQGWELVEAIPGRRNDDSGIWGYSMFFKRRR